MYSLLTYLLSRIMTSPYAPAMTASALGNVVCITFSFFCHKLFVFRTKGNVLKEYCRAVVVYSGAWLVSFPLLPVLIAALNHVVGPQAYVPYLAGAILTAGTVVVSFFGHKKFTFAQATIDYPQPREPLHATAGRDTPPDC